MFARKCGALVALLTLIGLAGLTPGVQAGWLGFRNDLGHAVVLQATSEKGQQSKPLTLQAGESTCDWVNDAAVRKIALFDARERPPRSELVRFEASSGEKADVLYVIRTVMRDGKRFIEVLKTTDTARKKK